MSATPSHRDVSSLLTEIELQTFDVSQHEWSLAETRALLRLATKTAALRREIDSFDYGPRVLLMRDVVDFLRSPELPKNSEFEPLAVRLDALTPKVGAEPF